jgi:hypothetical protein
MICTQIGSTVKFKISVVKNNYILLMRKQPQILVLFLSYIFVLGSFFISSCKSKLPDAKTCQKPTDIAISVNATDTRQYGFSLTGLTTDLKSVVWKVSNNVVSNPTMTAISFTFTNVGTYTVTADFETTCGDRVTLTKNVVVNFKTCIAPTEIFTLGGNINTYVYGLTTTVFTDIKSVIWKVMSGNNILSQEQRTDGNSFNYTYTASGSYTISAEIETVCGEKVNRTLAVTITVQTTAQTLVKIWDITLGGNSYDNASAMVSTSDGGTVIAGGSISNASGDKSENSKGSYDYWIVKLNSRGQKVWDKTIGTSYGDTSCTIITTTDGGFVLAGHSPASISGDKSESSKGGADYWIVKLNSNGQKVWDKTIGGRFEEGYPTLVATADGGFVVSGYSDSPISGDKSENSKGSIDYWIVKFNSNGLKVWDKTIGGSGWDFLVEMIATTDGGFVIAGGSYSPVSGDKSESSKGGVDYWIAKINGNGQKIWDKTIGTSLVDFEYPSAIVATADGGFVIAGSSSSNISGDKSENSKGNSDYWIIKLNSNGQKLWDKTIGGNDSDTPSAMTPTNDGGIMVVGSSSSNISGDKSENSKGGYDCWIVKLNSNGQKVWDKTIGGSGGDGAVAAISNSDGSLVIAGGSASNISGDKSENSKGNNDYWVIKLK